MSHNLPKQSNMRNIDPSRLTLAKDGTYILKELLDIDEAVDGEVVEKSVVQFSDRPVFIGDYEGNHTTFSTLQIPLNTSSVPTKISGGRYNTFNDTFTPFRPGLYAVHWVVSMSDFSVIPSSGFADTNTSISTNNRAAHNIYSGGDHKPEDTWDIYTEDWVYKPVGFTEGDGGPPVIEVLTKSDYTFSVLRNGVPIKSSRIIADRGFNSHVVTQLDGELDDIKLQVVSNTSNNVKLEIKSHICVFKLV